MIMDFEKPVKRIKPEESRLIYIAGPFDQRDQAKLVKDALEKEGHVVTSTWITSHLDALDEIDPETAEREALHDLLAIRRADLVVFLNGQSTSGGMHVEMGYAIAAGKPILLVGEPTSIFHHLKSVRVINGLGNLIPVILDAITRYYGVSQTGAAQRAI